ncbi:Mitochondrial carnitine/acylcarnitine carrier protein CACL [Caenorhabditis elegans]|uniref:Mitochondrial carnitine/acylcarnitine carrier protein CACL n=1 Tax=Caenorhabditis elegans TaxID=6239 RepID=M1ZJU4_CAEEL|nr:Mitochondrial carnitine/acylcarnitine carrier protein CACL [Caenorhabditis elegans]CCU83335.1 Mitochondrial carnitine/acylcarnitine carrier protein CACL [Caenorhabditis elegans]|eukprot:NP_001294735.1 SLC (SoLute Carrier) homolog [Caenorhabditis elegans]
MSALLDLFAGSLGGAAGVLAGHPLDTVKVRLQTQSGPTPQYRGTFHCFKLIVQKEGFRGLYKGMSSPLLSLSAINAIVFGVHGGTCRQMEDPDSITSHFVGGCAAGMAQSVIAAPTERIKLLLQIQDDKAHTKFNGPIDATKQLLRTHGLKSLTRGFLATVARDAPAFGVYFASYEWMARSMCKDGETSTLSSGQLLFAGGTAGMLSWLFNYQTDIIKSRFQADNSYKSYMHCIKQTYLERGYRGFFVGLNSALIRAFPSNAATFFTVEWTYRILLDFNVIDNVTKEAEKICAESQLLPKCKRLLTQTDFWATNNHFLLPEAGSTIVDPMLHGYRFF